MRLVVYSRFGLRFASHGPRIRSARAPALLAFSSAVGWVSGVRFDGEPPRVSVCISLLDNAACHASRHWAHEDPVGLHGPLDTVYNIN